MKGRLKTDDLMFGNQFCNLNFFKQIESLLTIFGRTSCQKILISGLGTPPESIFCSNAKKSSREKFAYVYIGIKSWLERSSNAEIALPGNHFKPRPFAARTMYRWKEGYDVTFWLREAAKSSFF